MLVSLGRVAAKIATAVGFQKGDDVLETLNEGRRKHLQDRRSHLIKFSGFLIL
jgi:hypothetical protein